MTFDPRARIEPFEQSEDWSKWLDELMERFATSPEAVALPSEGKVSWAGLVLEYAANFHGESLATLSPFVVKDVLLEVFPRKVSIEPAEGGEIVREMRAFFAFAGRAFDLSNVASCAAALVPGIEARVGAALADTSKYGMAKSFVMGGKDAGFDMGTEEGLNTWMMLQNAGLADSFFGGAGSEPVPLAEPRGKSIAARKAARKQQKKARRKNR